MNIELQEKLKMVANELRKRHLEMYMKHVEVVVRMVIKAGFPDEKIGEAFSYGYEVIEEEGQVTVITSVTFKPEE